MPMRRIKAMKRLLIPLVLLATVLAAIPLQAASIIYSATITVTNAAGTTNGQTLTVSSDVRTWTNSVVVAQSQILTNSTIDGAALKLFLHLSAYPFTGLSLRAVSTNAVELRTALDGAWPDVALSAGWGTVTMVTNIITQSTVVRIPLSAEPAAQQTNAASAMGAAVMSSANTNGLTPTSISTTSGNAKSADLSITNAIYWHTNAWAGPSNVLNAGIAAPVYTAWTPCSITGVTNTLAYQRRPISLLITNAANTNITVYYTGVGRFIGGVKSVVVTNGGEHYIQVEAGASTNVNMADSAHLWVP
jgi:hypothetical protein